jgi:uncharacterized protein YggE
VASKRRSTKEATMTGKLKWGAAGLILGLAAALSIPSFAQTTSPPPDATGTSTDRTVAVTGSATIKSAPDEAVVTLGVQTQAPTAEAAMQQNANAMSDVIAALLHDGLRQDDIATAWVNLYPNYSDSGLTIVGYTSENQVNATIRDMGKIGRIIDDAVAAGANVSSGISFQISDESKGLDDALGAAVADARQKAEVLAAAGGAGLGQVVSISEVSAPSYPPIYQRVAAEAAGAPTPVSPPTLETEVTVTVVWALT